MTTNYKSGNGLTPSAAKRPAFPSAKRYLICLKKEYFGLTELGVLTFFDSGVH